MDFSTQFSALIASGSFTHTSLIMRDAIKKVSHRLKTFFPNKSSADNIIQEFYTHYGYFQWEPEQKQEIFRQLALAHWNGST